MSMPEIPIILFQNFPPFFSSIWLNVIMYFEHLTHKKQSYLLLLFYLISHDYKHILLTLSLKYSESDHFSMSLPLTSLVQVTVISHWVIYCSGCAA